MRARAHALARGRWLADLPTLGLAGAQGRESPGAGARRGAGRLAYRRTGLWAKEHPGKRVLKRAGARARGR
eukprot:11357990-Alexandrium_andersonii.AAC.1